MEDIYVLRVELNKGTNICSYRDKNRKTDTGRNDLTTPTKFACAHTCIRTYDCKHTVTQTLRVLLDPKNMNKHFF